MSLTIDGIPLAAIQRINAAAEYPMALYQEHGAIDRYGYLKCLADDHGADFATLQTLLDVLPPSEDFDGLVSALEDYGGRL